MHVKDMRDAVAAAYSGPAWRLKVLDMPDRQVIAIFKSMVAEGRLGPHGKLLKKPHEPSVEKYQQLTIWDFMKKEKK